MKRYIRTIATWLMAALLLLEAPSLTFARGGFGGGGRGGGGFGGGGGRGFGGGDLAAVAVLVAAG